MPLGARFDVECKGEWQPLRLAQGGFEYFATLWLRSFARPILGAALPALRFGRCAPSYYTGAASAALLSGLAEKSILPNDEITKNLKRSSPASHLTHFCESRNGCFVRVPDLRRLHQWAG